LIAVVDRDNGRCLRLSPWPGHGQSYVAYLHGSYVCARREAVRPSQAQRQRQLTVSRECAGADCARRFGPNRSELPAAVAVPGRARGRLRVTR